MPIGTCSTRPRASAAEGGDGKAGAGAALVTIRRPLIGLKYVLVVMRRGLITGSLKAACPYMSPATNRP